MTQVCCITRAHTCSAKKREFAQAGEEFGVAKLREALTETAHLSVDEIRDEIIRRVRDWCTDAPQHDDLTFIVMKMR